MKKMVMDGDSPFLPQEIITNILIQLPVKSIIRFQCVSKDWETLSKTPYFITEHYRHSSNHNPFLLFVCDGDGTDSHTLHSCLLDREMQVLELENAPLIDSMLGGRIVSSSNGLICVEFFNTSHSVLLWNPAIKEVKLVPKAVDDPGDIEFCVGFGFSPIVNDWKIVRLYISVSEYMVQQVEVYSLSTGSWKEIEVGNLGGIRLRTHNGFSTNGTIFWIGVIPGVEEEEEFEGQNDSYVIVSFDIAMEVFTLIPMPAVYHTYRTTFTVYEDKLAVLFHTTISPESCLIHMHVMEEGTDPSAERWSWTKKYTSSPYPCLLYPVTIWRNEIVCNVDEMLPQPQPPTEGEMKNGETKIVLCNLTTNEFKMFAIPSCGNSHWILNYAESLVRIANIHIEDP